MSSSSAHPARRSILSGRQFSRMNLAALAAATTSLSGRLAGLASGDLTLTARMELKKRICWPRSRGGSGSMRVRDPVLQGLDFVSEGQDPGGRSAGRKCKSLQRRRGEFSCCCTAVRSAWMSPCFRAAMRNSKPPETWTSRGASTCARNPLQARVKHWRKKIPIRGAIPGLSAGLSTRPR